MRDNFQISAAGTILFDNGKFYLKATNGLYDLAFKDYSIFLLPLLEKEPKDFFNLLETNNEYVIIQPIILDLLKCPFEKKMEYWASKALDWLEHSDFHNDLLEWSKRIDINWMPQKMKHRFRKVFKINSYG